MPIRHLLIANRGEIAIRIARAAEQLGIRTTAIYPQDDAQCAHVRIADNAVALAGQGTAAYLDGAQIVALATQVSADAIHPGYGFLSESAAFATQVRGAGLTFVGPSTEALALFGDKAAARQLAQRCAVPVVQGTGAVDLTQARAFFQQLGAGAAIALKAVAGGGGRGIRIVKNISELDSAFERAQSEAKSAFGLGDLYVEQYLPEVRHVEVQILGDGTGAVVHAFERECSVQRRQQKIVEFAPAIGISEQVRRDLQHAALRMAREVKYACLGTFEFLVEPSGRFYFIETNARLQVEHTVTEAVLGVDLVQWQIQLADGESLKSLSIDQDSLGRPRGLAVQLRINMETMDPNGDVKPTGGTIKQLHLPSGPGIRVDTFAYSGYASNPRYDSLLAKLIVHSRRPDFASLKQAAYRALCECHIDGIRTNIPLLQNLLADPTFDQATLRTTLIEQNLPALLAAVEHPSRFIAPQANSPSGRAGARIDNRDPLAVLAHGRTAQASNSARSAASPEGDDTLMHVTAPLQGTVVSLTVAGGDSVRSGQELLVMDAMKMEHVIASPRAGKVISILVQQGDAVFEGADLVLIEPAETDERVNTTEANLDIDQIRPDLQEVFDRRAYGIDANRPDAVARRRKTGQRTARENVNDLVDPGTFVEYGALVLAAQRRRRPLQELIEKTPADGMIAGIGRVNGELFGDDNTRVVAVSYDYTVLAGTQGGQNHRKKDRIFEIAETQRLPVVFFTEGGGGRPGDTDGVGVAGLDTMAFTLFGRLSGLVPLIGITSGRCFAGNAALLGCCDVIIATRGSNIGMGGPAMIEGGGLGIFTPEEVGPLNVQVQNGVVDIAVKDEAEAVSVAKQYISYFQGVVKEWTCADQRLLRSVIPENRLRIYDVRRVIDLLADTGSVLELRRGFGLGMVTAFIRIEGRSLGVVANNPAHLAGAIDSDNADKATRFMQLCDAFDIPILFLCDTPGIMVGPEVEKTGLVRHAARMFVTGASVTVPTFTIVLRKGYGLGAQAMAGGSFKGNIFTVSWPTGEFGGMGLEGAVKLGYRNELEAIEDADARKSEFDKRVAQMYERGKAVSTASFFELDDVIDPLESRAWILATLKSAPQPEKRAHKKRPCIDTW